MGDGKIIDEDKVKKTDRETYWVEVNGSPVDTISLKKSREVALEPFRRRAMRPNSGERHKVRSARVNPESDGVTDSGIQIYRLWFSFIKLALELEDLGVTKLVTKQGHPRKDLGSTERENYERSGTFYQLKDTIPFKIKRGVLAAMPSKSMPGISSLLSANAANPLLPPIFFIVSFSYVGSFTLSIV